IARRHFAGTLAGKLALTAGLGGMGGAQAMGITMNEGTALVAAVDPPRARRRLAQGFPAVVLASLGVAAPRGDRDRTDRRARRGAVAVDYGNNLRGEAKGAGFADAFSYPGFVPEYIRPLFAEGRGPFRWVALSGDPEDIRRTDRLVLELFPKDLTLSRWIRL